MAEAELRDIQRETLALLLEFDRLSKALGLPYQLAAGTLLGAVRHRGFIPWDDDIDVCMSRAAFDHLLRAAPELLGPGFDLAHHGNDRAHCKPFAKLRSRPDGLAADRPAPFLDIFPFDTVAPATLPGRLHLWLTRKLLVATKVAMRPDNRDTAPGRPPAVRRLLTVVQRMLRRVGPNRLSQLSEASAKLYAGRATGFAMCLVSGAMEGEAFRRRIRRADSLTNCREAEFEGHRFPIPADYDEVLRGLYGDYLQLPPQHQRAPHHLSEILPPAPG